MAGNFNRFETLPDITKPFKLMLMILLLIMLSASYYASGWWIWLTLIMQLIATALLVFCLYMEIDKLFLANKWLVFEMVYSLTVFVNIVNTIIMITKLLVLHSALFGVAALFFFMMVILDGLNGVTEYNIWKQKGGSSEAHGPNVQPGDPGAMNRGAENRTSAFQETP